MDEATFREKLEIVLARVNPQLERVFGVPTTPWTRSARPICPWPSACAPISADGPFAQQPRGGGQGDPVRGAQATLLDIDHGTYPVRDLFQLHHRRRRDRFRRGHEEHRPRVGHHEGLHTRVGSGPMRTELDYETSDEGRALTEVDHEYGVTTAAVAVAVGSTA